MDISTSSTATNLRFFRIFKQWPTEQPYMWNCVSDIMNCCTVLIAIRSPSIRHNFIKHGSLNWSQNTHKYFQKHPSSLYATAIGFMQARIETSRSCALIVATTSEGRDRKRHRQLWPRRSRQEVWWRRPNVNTPPHLTKFTSLQKAFAWAKSLKTLELGVWRLFAVRCNNSVEKIAKNRISKSNRELTQMSVSYVIRERTIYVSFSYLSFLHDTFFFWRFRPLLIKNDSQSFHIHNELTNGGWGGRGFTPEWPQGGC